MSLPVFLVNGRESRQLDVADRGFHYGDGVFETIAFRQGRPQLWHRHLQRLQQACQRLSLTAVDEAQWLADIEALQPPEDAVIKLIVSRGPSGRGYAWQKGDTVSRVTAVYPWPDYASENSRGIQTRICQTPVSMNPALAGIKHLNRLDNVLARNEWRDSDIVEGFMLDMNQHIIEGTMSNVFCVLDRHIYTPALDHAGVAGIMRGLIMELCREMGLELSVIDISRENFLQMDSVFICNSLIGIWPVSRVLHDTETTHFSQAEWLVELQARLTRKLHEDATK